MTQPSYARLLQEPINTMLRFAANISFMFTEVPFMDRFAAASAAGFRAVEFHYPYDHAAHDVRARLDQYRLKPVLINIRAGSPSTGDWGLAGVPGREDSFRLCLAEAIEYASVIGVRQLNCLAGVRAIDKSATTCESTLIANLRHAAAECARGKLAINLEPINTQDVPGYLVSDTTAALRVMDAVGAQNLMLQYDCYHMQIMEGGGAAALSARIEQLLPRIGHIQFADAPGRNEPGSGDIDFAQLFGQLNRICEAGKYEGWVSAEYRPSANKLTHQTLAWLAADYTA